MDDTADAGPDFDVMVVLHGHSFADSFAGSFKRDTTSFGDVSTMLCRRAVVEGPVVRIERTSSALIVPIHHLLMIIEMPDEKERAGFFR